MKFVLKRILAVMLIGSLLCSMGLSVLAVSSDLAATENDQAIESVESDLDLSSSPDDILPEPDSTESNGTDQELPQNETENEADEKPDSGNGLATEEQPIPETSVVSKQMMLDETTDGDILSISVSPETVAPTVEDSPKTVTVRIEMYRSTPFTEYDNRRIYADFYQTTDNPQRSIDVRCTLDETLTKDNTYVFVGTVDVPYYAYSGVYRLEFLDDWFNDITYATERYRTTINPVMIKSSKDMPESWIQSFEVEGGGVQDEQAPILEDITAASESITMTGEPSTAKISLKVTDDLSGAVGIEGELFNPKYPDRDINFEVKDPVTDYLSADGYYEADITIPKYASSGNYHLSYLYLEDQNENYREYYDSSLAEYYEDEPNTEELSSNLAKTVFTVTNSQGDDFSPILKSVSISPNQVSVGDEGTVIVALEVEDAGGSGFDPESTSIIVQTSEVDRLRSHFCFVSQRSGTNIYEYSEIYRTTDTQKDVTYYVRSVSLKDFAGNRAFYRSTNIPRDGDIPLPNEAIMQVGNGGNNGGNSGGHSGGGGGGGGGGGKGGGGGASANLVKAATVTKSATAFVSASISKALKSNLKAANANIPITAGTEISPATVKSVVKAINTATKNKGVAMTPSMTLTKTSAGKVVSTISFNPLKFTAKTNVKLSVYTDDKATRTALSKVYKNKTQMVKFTQTGAFGMDVTVSAKLNLTGMNVNTLQFYTYDRTKKTLTPIAVPNYSIDKNGYLHFTTNMGDTVVITDSALQKKA